MTESEWFAEAMRLLRAQKAAASAAIYPATDEQTNTLVAANKALNDFMQAISRDEFEAIMAKVGVRK